jgi:hypothetical protein
MVLRAGLGWKTLKSGEREYIYGWRCCSYGGRHGLPALASVVTLEECLEDRDPYAFSGGFIIV